MITKKSGWVSCSNIGITVWIAQGNEKQGEEEEGGQGGRDKGGGRGAQGRGEGPHHRRTLLAFPQLRVTPGRRLSRRNSPSPPPSPGSWDVIVLTNEVWAEVMCVTYKLQLLCLSLPFFTVCFPSLWKPGSHMRSWPIHTMDKSRSEPLLEIHPTRNLCSHWTINTFYVVKPLRIWSLSLTATNITLPIMIIR